MANKDLKPEQAISYEFGADLRLFEGRVGLDVTYYQSNTKNQIIRIPLDIVSGYTSKIINAGEVENKGLEAMLNVVPVKTNDFIWNVGLNFSTNRGKVIKLTDGLDTYQMSENYVSVLAKEGERMGDVYGTGFKKVELKSLNGLTGQALASAQEWNRKNAQYVGQHIHNEDGMKTPDSELRKLGNYNPDYTLGISNSFNYKGFSFDFLFDYRKGGVVNSRTVLIGGTTGMLDFTTNGGDREAGVVSPGVALQPNGDYAPNTKNVTANAYYSNTYKRSNEESGMFDATYLKLREVKFGYTFKKPLFRNAISNLNLSVVGRNLALWTENPHFDPETLSFNGGTIVPGVEDMATPSTRSIGFNLSFNL